MLHLLNKFLLSTLNVDEKESIKLDNNTHVEKYILNRDYLFICDLNKDSLFSDYKKIQCQLMAQLNQKYSREINLIKFNSTIFFSTKISNIEFQEVQYTKQISKIEEDPYLFKKHVFCYTQKQIEKIPEDLGLCNILKTVNSEEEYKEYVNTKHRESSLYAFYHGLLTKLPFLRYNSKLDDIKKYDWNIEKQIQEQLDVQKLYSFHNAYLNSNRDRNN